MHTDEHGNVRLDNPNGEMVPLATGGTVLAKECRECRKIFQVTDGQDNGYCSEHRRS